MIVCKFGGTALTPKNVSKIKRIISLDINREIVVVSAIGKCFASDTKVTDLLIKLHNSLPDVETYSSIGDKYRELAQICGYKDINNLLTTTLEQIVKNNYYAFTVSRGEYLSSKIVSHYLNYKFIDASTVIKFSGKGIDNIQTKKLLQKNCSGNCVVGGFYGSDHLGKIKLFSRGGSDITGAIISEKLNATLYENWTDVNGFLLASPMKVLNPFTVPCINYSEIEILTRAGAEVLNYRSIKPVERKSIPINIRNIYNYANSGTIISNFSPQNSIFGIVATNESGYFVTKIVFSLPINVILQSLALALSSNSNNVISIDYSLNCITLRTTKDLTEVIYRSLT